MKQLILLLLIAASAHFAVAQKSKVGGQASQQNLEELGGNNNLNGIINTYDNRYEGIRGTPYYSNYWGTATINIKDVVYPKISIKYNLYENNILYKNDKQLLVLNLSDVDTFEFTDTLGLKRFTFKKVNTITNIHPKQNDKFAKVLFEGTKIKLINLCGKDLIKADFKGTYSSGKTYDEFIDTNAIYFIDINKIPQKIKLNKKALLSVLSDKPEKIKNFIAKEKIDTSTEDGWVKTLAYYETL